VGWPPIYSELGRTWKGTWDKSPPSVIRGGGKYGEKEAIFGRKKRWGHKMGASRGKWLVREVIWEV